MSEPIKITSQVYTPEQVDYIIKSYRIESPSALAKRFGTTVGSIGRVIGKAKMAGIIAARRREPAPDPAFVIPEERPKPSMPRVAWLERPMPRVNI